jgi:nitrite reductase (cytochrome c-552)
LSGKFPTAATKSVDKIIAASRRRFDVAVILREVRGMGRKWLMASALMLTVSLVVAARWRAPSPDDFAAVKAKEDCRDCHRTIVDNYAQSAHAGLACSQCHAGSLTHQDADDPAKVLPVVDFRIESCASCHRFQAETYLMDEPGTAGLYGGTPANPHEHPKTKDFPLYNKIIAGHGFTKDYNEERGHPYILRDHMDTKRGKYATCLNCKSTPVAYYWGRTWKGIKLDENASWEEVIARIPKEMRDYGASCAHCHNPHSTQLRIINKALQAAIAERGVNPYWAEKNAKSFAEADRQQKEILLCAQCHVEYVCGPGADKKMRFVFGWRKVRDLDAFYREQFGYQQDWVHAIIGEPLIKSQHPEVETFWESKYERAGASCVTCHMPKVKVNGRLLTSHWLTSPLKYLDRFVQGKPLGAYPCGECHSVPPTVLRAQVLRVQKHVDEAQKRVQQALSDSIDAIASAKQAQKDGKPVNEQLLRQAVRLHQWAHLRWENLVVSENSMGFHNPEEVLKELGEALDHARQAQLLTLRAVGSLTQTASRDGH